MFVFVLQVGGLMPVVRPIWTGYITNEAKIQIASMELNGTTGRAQATHWRPLKWWSDQ